MPVKKSASSLARNAQVFATSLGVEPRPSGIVAMNVAWFSGLPKKESVLKQMSVVGRALAGNVNDLQSCA